MFNNNTQVIINKQSEKEIIREVTGCYELENGNYIRLWNDGFVDVVDKELNRLESEQYDPEKLEELRQELDKEVKEYKTGAENYQSINSEKLEKLMQELNKEVKEYETGAENY